MLNLGAKCGLADLEAIVRLDNLCSRLGLDSTSASTAVAFAMDLFDRGILTLADTQGLDLIKQVGEKLAADARAVVELSKTFNTDAQKLAKESLSVVNVKAA